MRQVIIFSQAPADVKYVISLYEKYSERHFEVVICAVGLVQAEILKSLGFTPPLVKIVKVGRGAKTLCNLILDRVHLGRFLQKLSLNKNSEAIFFSNYFDYYTFFLIQRMKSTLYIKYMDICDVERPDAFPLSFKAHLKLGIIRFLFTKHLKYTCSGETLVPTFLFEKLGIEKVAPVCIDASSYCYPMPYVNGKRHVLFFESGFEPGVEPKSYESSVKQIIGFLCSVGMYVYIKPHPTFGSLNFDDMHGVGVLPKYVPGELLDVNKCSLILGFSSSALSMLAVSSSHVPVVSLIHLLDYSEEMLREHYIDYLRRDGGDKIVIVDSEYDFNLLLDEVIQ